MPNSAAPEPTKRARRGPPADDGATGAAVTGAAAESRAGAMARANPPAVARLVAGDGPRRSLSSEAWYSATTTPHCGQRASLTPAKPHLGHVSAITLPRVGRASHFSKS